MAARYSAKPEIEIKLRVSDAEALVAKLRSIGVKSLGRVLERNTLYDTAESHFHNRGSLLRLRTEDPAPSRLARGGTHRAVVTSKTPIQIAAHSRYKQKFERETDVAFADRWPRMLAELGLRAAFCYEKYRTMYQSGSLHIDLDETPVGVFLELEGDPLAIDRMAQRLGFSPSDYMTDTYWDLYVADCRKRGRVPRNMIFRA